MDKKEYKRWLKYQQELQDLHKRCIKSELFYMGVDPRTRLKFFRLYDLLIKPEKVREYFFVSIPVFIKAFIRDELDKVKHYYPTVSITKKKHKKK